MMINTEKLNVFWQLVRRPYKIIKNFLIWQIVFSLLAVLIAALLPYKPIQFSDHAKGKLKGESILFTKEELALYNGENGQPLYLALLGEVFDVSEGEKHYGPNCAYNYFVGRDASVSFVTGEFESYNPDTADDVVEQLKINDLLGLDNWKKFYKETYIYKGKLIGRFYDENGKSTKYHYKYLALLDEAEHMKADAEQLKVLYPDCNIKWSEEEGTHVWCTQTSGGKERDWKGYPRKLYEIGNDNFRCVCVREDNLQTTQVKLKEYDNCNPRAHECFYRID